MIWQFILVKKFKELKEQKRIEIEEKSDIYFGNTTLCCSLDKNNPENVDRMDIFGVIKLINDYFRYFTNSHFSIFQPVDTYI